MASATQNNFICIIGFRIILERHTRRCRFCFVATNGIDAEERGTFQKPFRTIRYAAEYVEDNFDPLSPVIIRVSTGKFEEVSPIISSSRLCS